MLFTCIARPYQTPDVVAVNDKVQLFKVVPLGRLVEAVQIAAHSFTPNELFKK
jgi:hypothetical protein